MRATTRRKLAMAVRALDFAQAHPSTDASYTSVVDRLKERLARADVLAMTAQVGQEGERGALGRRSAKRREVMELVRHLVHTAQAGFSTHPELAGKFWMPNFYGPHKAFIVAASALLEAAEPVSQTLLDLGMGDTLLTELRTSLAEFAKETDSAHGQKLGHVGAAAELESATAACMVLVDLLDGFYRRRFRDDPYSQAGWESARNVVGPFRTRRVQVPAPEDNVPVVEQVKAADPVIVAPVAEVPDTPTQTGGEKAA